jgi:hypothetical protein
MLKRKLLLLIRISNNTSAYSNIRLRRILYYRITRFTRNLRLFAVQNLVNNILLVLIILLILLIGSTVDYIMLVKVFVPSTFESLY